MSYWWTLLLTLLLVVPVMADEPARVAQVEAEAEAESQEQPGRIVAIAEDGSRLAVTLPGDDGRRDVFLTVDEDLRLERDGEQLAVDALRRGQAVRLHYRGGTVVRLELTDVPDSAEAESGTPSDDDGYAADLPRELQVYDPLQYAALNKSGGFASQSLLRDTGIGDYESSGALSLEDLVQPRVSGIGGGIGDDGIGGGIGADSIIDPDATPRTYRRYLPDRYVPPPGLGIEPGEERAEATGPQADRDPPAASADD